MSRIRPIFGWRSAGRHSHLHAFGIDRDDDGGTNNGHFALFRWRSK